MAIQSFFRNIAGKLGFPIQMSRATEPCVWLEVFQFKPNGGAYFICRMTDGIKCASCPGDGSIANNVVPIFKARDEARK